MSEEDDKHLTLSDLVQDAYDGLSALIEHFDLPPEAESIAAFTIAYGVHTPAGDIAIGHATPTNFRMDTPIVLHRVADLLHERNVGDIAKDN